MNKKATKLVRALANHAGSTGRDRIYRALKICWKGMNRAQKHSVRLAWRDGHPAMEVLYRLTHGGQDPTRIPVR